MKIQQTERFIKEKKFFYEQIQKITDVKRKKHFENVYRNFLNQVEIIDQNHSSISNQKIDPIEIKSSLEELNNYRRELNNLKN